MNFAGLRDWGEPPVPCVPRSDVDTLYSIGHYDGPATAIVRWSGEIWYAERFDFRSIGIRDRRYWLVRLTPKEQNYALRYCETWAAFFHSGHSWTATGQRVAPVLGRYGYKDGNYTGIQPEGRDEFDRLFPCAPAPSGAADVCGYFETWVKT